MKISFQIILLLGISLGSLANADICTADWLLEDYLSDSCYSCKDDNELLSWCTSYLNGDNIPPIKCCEGYGYDYQDIMPTEGSTNLGSDYQDIMPTEGSTNLGSDYQDIMPTEGSTNLGSDYRDIMPIEGSTDDDIVYDFGYEYSDIEDDESFPYDFEDYEYYDSDSDSDSDSDDESFIGFDLMDDELAGPITNEVLLPLPSALEEIDSITITTPSLVDFTASPDCFLASILGNNYVDSYQNAKQKCNSDLKEQLRLEFNSLLEQVSETKGNFKTFLQQYSDELTEDEIQEVKAQMADLDRQVIERTQRMRDQLMNPNCTKYTNLEKDRSIISAAEAYERVLDVDEIQAGNDIFCLENYLRKLQTKLEECQYEVMTLYSQLIDEDKTDLIFEKMCRSGDVQRVKDIVDEFFTEVSYESIYPTPVIEPMYPEEPMDTVEEMEQRRLELNRELEQLQQELDQAVSEKQIIFNKYVEVSNRHIYVEERINELLESGNIDSDEGNDLRNELQELQADQNNLKSELAIIKALIREIEEEMNALLSEEIQLEILLGVMPDQPEEPTTESPIDEFIDNLGPGPVQFQDVTTESSEVEEVFTNIPTEEVIYIIDDYDFPTETPHFVINDDRLFESEEEEGEHHGKLSKYLIGVSIGVLALLGVLMMSLCIPLAVVMNRNKGKKVPYDKASLAEKDPAILLKQTGFENPIYKFYVENSKGTIN
ncbi:hypothetical protein LOD99_2066 [Oopsacas minuta]|uniref:Uncharacterized protein n=1 Tax=Oopsacas minuta TaxID=111878 RepID=A0AAV7K2U6_9METZ|nr:hypothetical protein LOD99_2066 [Oopsacas minuta]